MRKSVGSFLPIYLHGPGGRLYKRVSEKSDGESSVALYEPLDRRDSVGRVKTSKASGLPPQLFASKVFRSGGAWWTGPVKPSGRQLLLGSVDDSLDQALAVIRAASAGEDQTLPDGTRLYSIDREQAVRAMSRNRARYTRI